MKEKQRGWMGIDQLNRKAMVYFFVYFAYRHREGISLEYSTVDKKIRD